MDVGGARVDRVVLEDLLHARVLAVVGVGDHDRAPHGDGEVKAAGGVDEKDPVRAGAPARACQFQWLGGQGRGFAEDAVVLSHHKSGRLAFGGRGVVAVRPD
jgi:hypothetical protein